MILWKWRIEVWFYGFLGSQGRMVKVLKAFNVCRDAAGFQRGVWALMNEMGRIFKLWYGGTWAVWSQPFQLVMERGRKAFSQYCWREGSIRAAIGLLNIIGFSPISFPFSNDWDPHHLFIPVFSKIKSLKRCGETGNKRWLYRNSY